MGYDSGFRAGLVYGYYPNNGASGSKVHGK